MFKSKRNALHNSANMEFIGSSDAANGYIAGAMLMIKLWVPTGVGQ